MTGERFSLGISPWNGGTSLERVLETKKKKKSQSQRIISDRFIIKASFHFFLDYR